MMCKNPGGVRMYVCVYVYMHVRGLLYEFKNFR